MTHHEHSEFSRQQQGGQRQPPGGGQQRGQPPQQPPTHPQGHQPPQQMPPGHQPQGQAPGMGQQVGQQPPQQQPQQPMQGMGQSRQTGQPQRMDQPQQMGQPQQQASQQQPQQPMQGMGQGAGRQQFAAGMQQPAGGPQGTAAVPPQRGPSQAQVPARAGGPRLQPVEVGEVARTDVVTVEPDATVAEIVSKMADQDVGSVVVVEDDRPVGIVTDRKIALALADTSDLADHTADEFATRDLVTGTTDTSVFDAIRRLRDEGVRRLPLVDDDGRLEGIVTLDDVVVLLAGELGVAAEIVETQAPQR